MPKPTILFVDDEPHVLSGLRRALLPSHRDEWELHFAEGGAAALECLAASRIDILVTDMRMPGMDGATLLDKARVGYPSTARLVLSGHADRDSIINAAGSAQQFLSKPCDPAALAGVLKSTLASRALIRDPGLRSVLGTVAGLPKPPAIYAELKALASSPDITIADLGRLIERDVATTTELLKLVNSTFFGAANDVTSIDRAVQLLGLDVIQALVLPGQLFRPELQLPPDLPAEEVADRGLQASKAVRRTAAIEGWSAALTGQVCLAAFLYDVGLLVLAANDPGAWSRYRDARGTMAEREAQLLSFGCTIGQASGYLLGLWGFHPTVVKSLAEQPIQLGTGGDASPIALAVTEAHEAAGRAPVGGTR